MKARLIAFAAIALTGIIIAGFMIKGKKEYENSTEYREKHNNVLKIINPYDVNPALVDDSIKLVRTGHTIADFKFVNQYGDTITQKNLEGKIYVADFFFTTCGSVCPKLAKQMQRLQAEFINDDWLMLINHTVWPEGDSVSTLYDYSVKYKADPNKWWFLTGDKEQLYTMARKSYLAVPDKADPNFKHGSESDFIHTENFILVDPDKRIRGMYDGTNPDEVSDLIKDIYDLKREYGF